MTAADLGQSSVNDEIDLLVPLPQIKSMAYAKLPLTLST